MEKWRIARLLDSSIDPSDYVSCLRTDWTMPTCCWCNASGKCRSCKCVIEGSQCVDCLPGRLENCANPAVNIQSTQATQTIQSSPNHAASRRSQPNQRNQDTVSGMPLVDVCAMLPEPEELSKEPIYWGAMAVSLTSAFGIQSIPACISIAKPVPFPSVPSVLPQPLFARKLHVLWQHLPPPTVQR